MDCASASSMRAAAASPRIAAPVTDGLVIARANAAVLSNRSAGAFMNARAIAALIAGGTLGRVAVTGRGVSVIGCPAYSRMFSGLRSRWITPWPCACSSALATAAVMRMASSTGSCCSRSSRARSVSPSMNGIT